MQPQLGYYRQKCLHCGQCAACCPARVFSLGENGNQIRFQACSGCGLCVERCPGDALELLGRTYEAEEIVQLACRDKAFYGSTGGVTLSGGEPCLQPAFAGALLRGLRENGIHTALDTCGICDWKTMQPLLADTNLVLFDLKHMDSAKHRSMTGVPNEQILDNFQRIHDAGVQLLVRIPVIPDFNDDMENWERVAAFLRPYPDVPVELLAYHRYGISKYEAIGRPYTMTDWPVPEAQAMRQYREYLQNAGITCV